MARAPESIRIAVGYVDATYEFSWRPLEPGILVRVACDAASGDAGEATLLASRPADVARLLDVLRRLVVALPGPLGATTAPAHSGGRADGVSTNRN